MKRILVTGAGALLGQGILRCLNICGSKYHIITADPDYRAQGHSLGQMAYIIPFANHPDYIKSIKDIIENEKVDAVLVGTDVELPIFAQYKQELETLFPVSVIVSNTEVVAIANDKWLTAKFLKENNFPYPLSALTSKNEEIEFLKENSTYPYIAKPIDGARSKGIVIINNEKDLEEVCSYKNNLVVQELLSEDNGEYTTGCIVLDGKCKAIVSLRRDLRDGNTYRAYRDGSEVYDDVIKSIAEALGADGPVNFQYRIKNGQPVIFEINGRFSGTTPLRFMFGFNEVDALLDHVFGVKEMTQPQLKNGTVLRTFSDLFVANEQLVELREKGSLKDYISTYYPFYSNKR
ncbi:MAG TPA: ATP-grasp domain-containing protein [Chitinophagaceae bacterium]|nr:ATP-grasp domain-containing protein [Chitinophagaceae bacterium]